MTRSRGRGKIATHSSYSSKNVPAGGLKMENIVGEYEETTTKSDVTAPKSVEACSSENSLSSASSPKSEIKNNSAISDDCQSQTSSSDNELNVSSNKLLGSPKNVNNDTNVSRYPRMATCMMAPALPPAPQRETVRIKTNLYSLKVHSRTVYRYDVRISIKSFKTVIDLCKGNRDDAEVTSRHRKCMLFLKRAFELYRLLSETGAYIYDMSSTLFTNEILNKDLLPRLELTFDQLTDEIKSLITCEQGQILIEISPCIESAFAFDIADYQNSVTSDLAIQDHSLRQFFEILTNNSALHEGTHFVFGSGKLFLMDGKKYKLDEQPLNEARTLITGVDKGVRFIGGGGKSIVPALVLDVKKAVFFDSIPLSQMLGKLLSKKEFSQKQLDRKSFEHFVNKLNELIRDLRLQHINSPKRTFLASGLSNLPVSKLSLQVKRKGRKNISLLEYYTTQGFHIRSDWPAVILMDKTASTAYFPIETLHVAPLQRVPLSKQTTTQTKDSIKLCAISPHDRFAEITRNLQALDLDDRVHVNPYLAAFGVRVCTEPLTVEGHRRNAPKVRFRRGNLTDVDRQYANWRAKGKEYLISAHLKNWFIFYDDVNDAEMIKAFADVLERGCQKKGIRLNYPKIEHVPFENLEANMKRLSDPDEIRFVMYIDSRPDTHDDLKLFEVLYGVLTQHVHGSRARDAPKKAATLENIINKLNCKNFGQCYAVVPESFASNKWISTGKTLIVGYDVCHPEPQAKHERRLNIPCTQPSVIGISFNGAVCAETFIGDYSFQEARKEQVTSAILEDRIFWILSLFEHNRGALPELIVITRDGVSEGQFRMVMEEEIEAIRQGIRNYDRMVLNQNYKPKIVCIIACKRHNKRFAVQDGKSLKNCAPLTVIDKDITRLDTTEFFMQSHPIIRGTGKLPAYVMPINEANLTMDEVQSLIMALCFTHQIVNQGISLPEPIFQADEWAKRGRNNFKTMVRRIGGSKKLPVLKDTGAIDWARVTDRLCYRKTPLQLTRANA